MDTAPDTSSSATFNRDDLNLDVEKETQRIVQFLQNTVLHKLHRQGAVVGISGGIDSSAVLALCAQAFGPERVVGIMLPERESSAESAELAQNLADHYGVTAIQEDITAALEGAGCYQRRDEAIRRVFPEFCQGWKAKIVLPANLLDQATLNIFRLTVTSPEGQEFSKRLPPREYSQIVAASNFKQRTRMSMLYYHAELRNYAVMGTANKNEHDQGFFVKYGDAGVDIKAIGHLYKTQVYQLADFLDIPKAIRERPPTSDTYSAACTQQEFFFRLPFDLMDLLWYAQEHNIPPAEVARVMELEEVQVQRAYEDFYRKSRTTDYLRMHPLEIN